MGTFRCVLAATLSLGAIAAGAKADPATTRAAEGSRLTFRITGPAGPQPTAYACLVRYEIANDGPDALQDDFTFDDSAFDVELTAADGTVTRRPLGYQMLNGHQVMGQWSIEPGESAPRTARLKPIPAGTYAVRIVNRVPDAPGENPWPPRRTFAPVASVAGTLSFDDSPATRERWLAERRAAIENLDAGAAQFALGNGIAPLRARLIEMLADPASPDARFAAEQFWFFSHDRPRDADDLDPALDRLLRAVDAMPLERRTHEFDGALMRLVQNRHRADWLELTIRWSRAGGSKDRDAAMMALQPYRDDPRVVETMAALLGDPAPSVALDAARYLCDWRRDERALPVLARHALMLEQLTSQPDVYFSEMVKYGRHPIVLATIERGLADPRPEVAKAAADARAKLPPASP